jgi:uncharacterized protein (DUF1697 family)
VSASAARCARARRSVSARRQIVLLRGVNVGAHNRISMPRLRELLTAAGFGDVRTYMQSGNVVLSSEASPEQIASESRTQIAEAFGLDIAVVVRSHEEIAAVLERNPLGDVAVDPKRYQVSFLSDQIGRETVDRLAALAVAPEQFAAAGRELYAWHPTGVARSKLAAALAGPTLGATATARNWATVTALRSIAEQST